MASCRGKPPCFLGEDYTRIGVCHYSWKARPWQGVTPHRLVPMSVLSIPCDAPDAPSVLQYPCHLRRNSLLD